MATFESLQARNEGILSMYHDNEERVLAVQDQALEELLPVLEEELDLQEAGFARAKAFLEDTVTVFRFCRRARFSSTAALKLLHATLTYRLTSTFATLSASTIAPIYLTEPLFFFHPDLMDRWNRPCAVLNLKYVRRTEDGELEGLKELVRFGWEIGRRWLTDLSRSGDVTLQMVVIVDLEGAGMSNLEVELLPFFMDLLKNHFPGMVGAIFVLNYGWMYSGMWQLAKRVLPNTALERIIFPSKPELLQFFEEDHLLVEHGGKVEYTYTPSNPILSKYGRSSSSSSHSLSASNFYPSPLSSPSHSSPPSRNTSSDSLNSDTFHSAPNTPALSRNPSFAGRSPNPNPNTTNLWHSSNSSQSQSLSKRPSGLSMTSLSSSTSNNSGKSDTTEKGASTSSSGVGGSRWGWGLGGGGGRGKGRSDSESTIRRVTSFAELQERLIETQMAIESDSEGEDEEVSEGGGGGGGGEGSIHSGEEWDGDEEVLGEREGEEGEWKSGETSARSSRFSSRVGSRVNSRAVSREGSPNRVVRVHGRDGETFSNRAVKFSGAQHVSPYNQSNPFYGYPAFVPSRSLDPSGIPRPHFQRRRKRDLVRTLTYLAVLRFLALHRQIKWRFSVIMEAILRISGLRAWSSSSKGKEGQKKGTRVRWEEATDTKGMGTNVSPGSGSEGGKSGKANSSPSSKKSKGPSSTGKRAVAKVAVGTLLDTRIVIALLLVVLLRSKTFKGAVVGLVERVRTQLVGVGMGSGVKVVVGGVVGGGAKPARRKRDALRRFLGRAPKVV